MKTNHYLIIALISAALLNSCSSLPQLGVQKRKHNKGFYVAYSKADNKVKAIMDEKKEIKQNENPEQYKLDDASIDKLFADSDESVTDSVSQNIKSETKTVNASAATDLLYPKKKVETNFDMALLTAIPTSPASYAKSQKKTEAVWDVTGGGPDESGGENKTFSILGLIFSSVGCVSYYGSCLLSTGGIVLSSIALSKIKKNPGEYGGKTMATLGLILGIVGLVAWTAVIILYMGAAYSS